VVFNYVNRGLFNSDKLTVATQLCFRILLDANKLDPASMRSLLIGAVPPVSSSPHDAMRGGLEDWLPTALWPRVKALEAFKPTFDRLGEDMQARARDFEPPPLFGHPLRPLSLCRPLFRGLQVDSDRWQMWFNDATPELVPLPGDYRQRVSSFSLLLLLRALRPDRLAAALRAFVAEELGAEFVQQTVRQGVVTAPFLEPAASSK
jgi:dynein heavy chain